MRKAYAFSLDDEALRGRRTKAAADRLAVAPPDRLHDRLGGRVVLARQASAAGHARHGPSGPRAPACRRGTTSSPSRQRIWRLFVAERLRRETALSLQLFRNFVEVRVPFLEPALVAALMAAPPSLKTHDTIQEFILRRRRPSFLDVVNANTGARVGAGRTTARLSSLKLRIFAKLGLPGYQPYERLGSWLAHELQPWLRRVLVADNVLEGQITADEWKGVVDQHASRQRNHTFLLMAGAILSLQLQARRGGAATAGALPTGRA